MSYRPPPLALLRTFEAAARHLSFKQAAAELHVTPAAVSQQIKALEGYLGVLLFHRLTRALKLSERGAAMLPPVQQGLACLDGAVNLARLQPEGGVVVVTTPPSFATYWLLPRLADFYATHPGIEVRLASSSSTVDRPGASSVLDALAQAVGDASCPLAVLFGAGDYQRFAVDALLRPAYGPVCAPGLINHQRPPGTPADLARQVLIHDDTLGDLGAADGAAWGWPQWLSAAGLSGLSAVADRHFSNAVLAIEAAVAGQGVVLAARELVASHLAAGTLVAPFALAVQSPYSYYLVAHRREADRPAVAAFRRWLIAQATAPMSPIGDNRG